MSGITLIPRTEASIPTPATGKVTFFIDSDQSNALAYMNDARVVTLVDGADGAEGPQGPPGMDGRDGADGEPGPPGADGAGGGSALTVEEVDGSPTGGTIDKIVFPNDTVQISGNTATVRQVPTAFIGCKAYLSASQTVTPATETAVNLDAEDFDSDGLHSNVTNNTRITIPAGMGGKWLVGYRLHLPPNPGASYAYLRKNGSTAIQSTEWDDSHTGHLAFSLATLVDLAAGDYVELIGYRTTGTSFLGGANASGSAMWAYKLDSGKVGAGIGAKVYRAATQSVGDASFTALSFDSEESDTDGFWTVGAPTRLTVPAGLGGKYLLTALTGNIPADADGTRILAWRKNGATYLRTGVRGTPSGGAASELGLAVVADLIAGDYVEAMLYQSSGASQNVGHASDPAEQISASIARLDSGSVAPMTVRGRVAADGTLLSGTGFSVAKTATGRYTITFAPGFSAIPVVICTTSPDTPGVSNGLWAQIDGDATTTTTVEVWTLQGTTGNATDCDFNFIAMAVA